MYVKIAQGAAFAVGILLALLPLGGAQHPGEGPHHPDNETTDPMRGGMADGRMDDPCTMPVAEDMMGGIRRSMEPGAMGGMAGMRFQMECMKTMMMPGAEMTANVSEVRERMYLRMMILHHEGAIRMAEMAMKNASRPEIIDMSEGIVQTQQEEIDRMSQWLATWHNETPPEIDRTPLGMAMHAEIAMLENTTGDAFDETFVSMMIRHHLMAVHMSDHAIDFAPHEEVRDLAGEISREQRAEVHKLRTWRAEWFNGPPPPESAAPDAPEEAVGRDTPGIGLSGGLGAAALALLLLARRRRGRA